MLFNEPKLLKSYTVPHTRDESLRFSALQRAEIAEIAGRLPDSRRLNDVSVLFNEPKLLKCGSLVGLSLRLWFWVSVLFNEPKLLKFIQIALQRGDLVRFSALQRAEIAEIVQNVGHRRSVKKFQCSSTSRNC